jgi:hypothetical protein
MGRLTSKYTWYIALQLEKSCTRTERRAHGHLFRGRKFGAWRGLQKPQLQPRALEFAEIGDYCTIWFWAENLGSSSTVVSVQKKQFITANFPCYWLIRFVGSLRGTGLDTYTYRPSRQCVAGTRIRKGNIVEGKTLPRPLLGQEHHPQLQLAAALLQPRCGEHKPSCFWNRKVKSVWFWRFVCWLHVIHPTALCVYGDQ